MRHTWLRLALKRLCKPGRFAGVAPAALAELELVEREDVWKWFSDNTNYSAEKIQQEIGWLYGKASSVPMKRVLDRISRIPETERRMSERTIGSYSFPGVGRPGTPQAVPG
jgi:hypothetical protein